MAASFQGIFAVLHGRSRAVAIAGLAVLLLAGCSPRQPHPLPERSQIPFGQGRLWQVDREGLASSYVFATLRMSDKRMIELPEAVQTAFAASEIAAFEGFGGSYPEAYFVDVDRLKLTGGETLEDLIGGRSFGILRWHMKRSELQPKNNIKPWPFWLYMGGENFGFVDYDSLYSNRRYDTTFDSWLQDRARKEGKEVVDLETYQERFDIYDKIPLDRQADMLKVTLDRYSKSAPKVPKVQLYLDGDLAMLDAIWREYLSWLEPATAQHLDDRRINNRNRVMVARAVPLMEKESTFVAVDVLHLPGEQGILHLLEQQGYTVTRLH